MDVSPPIFTHKGGTASNPAVALAREIVLEHGWNSTSFQIVNPGIKRWFSDRNDAVVGFVPAAGFRVAAGAPACEANRLAEVAANFEADAAQDGQRVCYFAAESRLESLYNDQTHSRVLLGAQPVWNPNRWPEIIRMHKSLRAQLNRARNKGVTVAEWPCEKAKNNADLETVLHAWLDSKGLPPLHFMVEPETLSRLEHRRIFVGQCRGSVVGFVLLSPVAKRNGWLIEQFPHRPGAPNGTVELMIDAAMRAVAADGCEYVTLGLSPLSTRADDRKFRNPAWLRIFLFWLRKHGQRFYNFEGLDDFKAKLRPESWEPVFAVSNEPRITFKMLYAIASAFSGNAPFRLFFGGLWRALSAEERRFAKWLSSIS